MHQSVFAWGYRTLGSRALTGKAILEVGSCNVNGSLRWIVERKGPKVYLGIDIEEGPGVDLVMDASEIPRRFPEQWDLVICTEMLEHASDWHAALLGIKSAPRVGGHLLLTTRGPGFPRHEFPDDYWRFTSELLKGAFGGYNIEQLRDDPEAPGVFIFARREARNVDVPSRLGAEKVA